MDSGGRVGLGSIPTMADVERAMERPVQSRKHPKWPVIVSAIQQDPEFGSEIDSCETFPTFTEAQRRVETNLAARKTKHGGVKHADRSKILIGNANKGKTVWNKGSQRSAEDRASISKGVKNKNDLEKLENIKRYNAGKPKKDQYDLDRFAALGAALKKQRNHVSKARGNPIKLDYEGRKRKLVEMETLRNAIYDPSKRSKKKS